MTTTREAALEAALTLARNRLQACAIDHPTGSREMYERSEWADEATAALSTPATEPHGYVEIAKDRADWLLDAVACTTQNRQFLRGEPEYDEVAGEAILLNAEKAISVAISRALAARPAPQPAADTRADYAAALSYASSLAETLHDKHYSRNVSWNPLHDLLGLLTQIDNMVAGIIGDATPAPSDKIAEAARVLLDAPGDVMTGFAIDVMRANRLRDGKRIGYQPAIISALRTLAGKGE